MSVSIQDINNGFARAMFAVAALSLALVSCISYNNYSRVNNPYVAHMCAKDMNWCKQRMEYINDLHSAIMIIGLVAFSPMLLVLIYMFTLLVKKNGQ